MLRRPCSSLLSSNRGRCNRSSSSNSYSLSQPQRRDTFSPSFSRPPTSNTRTAVSVAPKTSTSTSSVKETILNSLKRNLLLSQFTSRDVLPIIGNGAYIAIVSGFLMTDMLQLRLMLVGGYTGLVAFHSLHPKPLKIPLRWSALFVLVNAGAAGLLVLDQWGASLTDDEETLFKNHFQVALTRGQFFKLMRMSRQETIPDGTALTTEGQVSPFLYFILEGQAKVYHNKTFAAFVDQGGFVNDVAFQQTQSQQKKQQHSSIRQGEGAYGTVVTNGDCKVLVWDQEALKEHLANRLDMDRNLKYLLSQHLMKSLLKQREARHALECGEDGQRHQQQVETSSTSATTEGWYSMAPNA